jgi:hypothetical protein
VFLGHLKVDVQIWTNEKIAFWFANGETIKEICIVERMCCCGRAETFKYNNVGTANIFNALPSEHAKLRTKNSFVYPIMGLSHESNIFCPLKFLQYLLHICVRQWFFKILEKLSVGCELSISACCYEIISSFQ